MRGFERVVSVVEKKVGKTFLDAVGLCVNLRIVVLVVALLKMVDCKTE